MKIENYGMVETPDAIVASPEYVALAVAVLSETLFLVEDCGEQRGEYRYRAVVDGTVFLTEAQADALTALLDELPREKLEEEELRVTVIPAQSTPPAPSGENDPNLTADRPVTVEGESAADQEARLARL